MEKQEEPSPSIKFVISGDWAGVLEGQTVRYDCATGVISPPLDTLI